MYAYNVNFIYVERANVCWKKRTTVCTWKVLVLKWLKLPAPTAVETPAPSMLIPNDFSLGATG